MRCCALLGLALAAALAAPVGAAGAAESTLRDAVVRVEVAVDPFSWGPELQEELQDRQPWSPFEAELARRLRVGSVGTGFFVNAQGDVVTNAHVLLSGVRYRGLGFTQAEWESLARLLTAIRAVWVTVGEGERERCYLAAPVALAEDLDLAVVRVAPPPGERTRFVHLALADSDRLRVGQPITALGCLSDGLHASGGEVLSLIHGARVHEEMRLVRQTSPETGQAVVTVSGTSAGPLVRIQHSAPTGHGSSGGPILDARGGVIGVAYALLLDKNKPSDPNSVNDLNLAIASNVLKAFLKAHAIPYQESAG